MTLRIGVVGTGMMGQDHIQRLAASVLRVEIVAVSDVNLCLDTGHVAYYRGDNVALIRDHPDRIGYLHLKQADPAVLDQVEAESLSFAEAVGRGAMCEPPQGEPGYQALLDAVDRHLEGELFAIVEQDLYPCDPDDPLPIATRTCAYLRQLGVGSDAQ